MNLFTAALSSARLVVAAASLSAATLSSTPALAREGRPNIVLILSDDQGWTDIGSRSDFYETPNLDALARQGMVFSNAYAAGSNCAPSRACLLSGQYSPRHHVFTVGSTGRGPKPLMRLLPIPNKSGLPATQVTVTEALKVAGYATGIFGKWHLGGQDGADPKTQGFDVEFNSYHLKPQDRQNETSDDPKGVASLTKAACEFIDANKAQPFFVYLPHHATHGALESRAESRKKFMAKKAGKYHGDALYAACLYDLDDAIGILLRKLDELKLADNTLVIFASDNGGVPWSPQAPLRGMKGSFYEGGIRVPLIARWTGKIKAGATCDVPVSNVDFYPTFLAAAAAQVPAGKVLDGENLVPLLQGRDKLRRESIFWHFPGYLDIPLAGTRDPVFRTRPVSVIRKGDWKLHLYLEEWLLDGGKDRLATNNAVELYNIADDIGEQKECANTHPAKRDELLGDLLKWFESSNAPLPAERNPDYNPDTPPPRSPQD